MWINHIQIIVNRRSTFWTSTFVLKFKTCRTSLDVLNLSLLFALQFDRVSNQCNHIYQQVLRQQSHLLKCAAIFEQFAVYIYHMNSRFCFSRYFFNCCKAIFRNRIYYSTFINTITTTNCFIISHISN